MAHIMSPGFCLVSRMAMRLVVLGFRLWVSASFAIISVYSSGLDAMQGVHKDARTHCHTEIPWTLLQSRNVLQLMSDLRA